MRKTFIVRIDTEYDDFYDWIIAHDKQIRINERLEVIKEISLSYHEMIESGNPIVILQKIEQLKENK